jgi:hypothetical protein
MSSGKQRVEQPVLQCEGCFLENSPLKVTRYTREQLITHVSEKHNGFGLCKGCLGYTWKRELEAENGWCGLCVDLCYDCMDREKYPE